MLITSASASVFTRNAFWAPAWLLVLTPVMFNVKASADITSFAAPALRQALAGRFRPHHAFLVSQVLAHLDYLDEAIETASARIDEAIAPFAAEVIRLDTIPGV